MKRLAVPDLLVVASLLSLAVAQADKSTRQKAPTSVAYISRYYIAESAPGSSYETGPLHILYSDGTEITEELPPKKKSTEDNVVFNQEGFADPQLAADRLTIGWTETYDNCCTSYAIPLMLVIFRSGEVIRRVDPGLTMIWSWMFVDGGERVAIATGPTHGPEIGDFRLYDVNTGKMISEVFGDENTQALKPDAPKWAKDLEARFNGTGK